MITIRQRVNGKSEFRKAITDWELTATWKSSDVAASSATGATRLDPFRRGRIPSCPTPPRPWAKRPLVTDPGLAMPMIADAMVALRKAGIEVALFSDVRNPIARNVWPA